MSSKMNKHAVSRRGFLAGAAAVAGAAACAAPAAAFAVEEGVIGDWARDGSAQINVPES